MTLIDNIDVSTMDAETAQAKLIEVTRERDELAEVVRLLRAWSPSGYWREMARLNPSTSQKPALGEPL